MLGYCKANQQPKRADRHKQKRSGRGDCEVGPVLTERAKGKKRGRHRGEPRAEKRENEVKESWPRRQFVLKRDCKAYWNIGMDEKVKDYCPAGRGARSLKKKDRGRILKRSAENEGQKNDRKEKEKGERSTRNAATSHGRRLRARRQRAEREHARHYKERSLSARNTYRAGKRYKKKKKETELAVGRSKDGLEQIMTHVKSEPNNKK